MTLAKAKALGETYGLPASVQLAFGRTMAQLQCPLFLRFLQIGDSQRAADLLLNEMQRRAHLLCIVSSLLQRHMTRETWFDVFCRYPVYKFELQGEPPEASVEHSMDEMQFVKNVVSAKGCRRLPLLPCALTKILFVCQSTTAVLSSGTLPPKSDGICRQHELRESRLAQSHSEANSR